MKKSKITLISFCIAVVLFLIMSAVFLKFKNIFSSDYQTVQTESGVIILFLKDESLPYIHYRILFPRAGADYDFKGKSGLSFLTAYLSEQGAGGWNSEKLQGELNQLGSSLGIDVGHQKVSMTLSGLSWHREKLWELLKKVIAEPHFEEKEMDILRRQVLEARFKELDQSSNFTANAVLRNKVFQGVIGKDEAGNLNSLSKISLEDIKTFYNDRYLGESPVFIVAGQYDEKLKKDIISFFNDTFSNSNQEPDLKVKSPPAGFHLLTNDKLVQAEIRMAYTLDSFPIEKPKKVLIFRIANFILGSNSNARLYVSLRNKKGLTYGAYSSFIFGKFYGIFALGGTTKTASVKEFLVETMSILRNFREKGISLQELKRAKQGLRSNYLQNIETPESYLETVVQYNYYLGVDDHFLKNYLDILESISLEEVNQSIKEFVLVKPFHVLVYGHSSLKNQLEGFEEEGLPPIQHISFEDYFKEELDHYSKIKKSL